MSLDFADLLHPTIRETCLKLLTDGHPKAAVKEAMQQVENALQDKSLEPEQYGVALVQFVFRKGGPLALPVRFDEKAQRYAKMYFEGAFGYYRNYAYHRGGNITPAIAERIMVIASELLDIIDASARSFAGVGGVEGLVEKGVFESAEDLYDLLRFLSAQVIIDETFDGMLEEMYHRGHTDEQLQWVFQTGLVRMHFEGMAEDYPCGPAPVDVMNLTELGEEVLEQADQG